MKNDILAVEMICKALNSYGYYTYCCRKWERQGYIMENKHNTHKGKYGSNILLLAVLIGFCILAIIEILYGQAQIRMERERLALEEDNHQAVQELKEEWDNLKGDPSVAVESIEETGEEQIVVSEPEKTLINTSDSTLPANSVSENSGEDEREYDMQIVFMGDSILDNNREEAGVASLISDGCNAKVYNMAIGGTYAALMPNEQYNFEEWNSQGLLGVVNAILGNINPGVFAGTRAGEILEECDFDKTDYFVIEYGVNDFLSGKIPQSRYLENGDMLAVDDVHTYSGALDTAIHLLRERFPDAKILLIAPHYCQIFNAGTYVGDAYSVDYGYGTLVDFFRSAGYVADQYKKDNVIFYNAMEQSGIDAYTADQYLEDGVHLTEEGRRAYADYPIRLILADFYPEE